VSEASLACGQASLYHRKSNITIALKLYHKLITHVTISANTCIVCTRISIEKQFKSEIKHATGKNLQGLMGPAISKGSFKSTKIIYHLTPLAMESSKIFVSFL